MPIKNYDIEKIKFKTFKPPKEKRKIRWFWNNWRWLEFWYTYTHNGIWGPGGRSYKTFRTSRLSLIISILAFLLMLAILIWK